MNTAKLLDPLAISVWGSSCVQPVEVNLPVTDESLTVYTPKPGYIAAIVGLDYKELKEHSLSLSSCDDDTEVIFMLSANSGISQGIGRELLFVTPPGKPLKVSTSHPIAGPLMFYLIESDRFFVSR